MAGRHVVVSLIPVYLPDSLPFRTLTIAGDEECISVGRASKSESKHLVPAHNNAWFDSRVMSRNHAMICASLFDKKVLVGDTGSMHGTYVNDKKVPIDEDVEINTGDVLTFGNEVTRWPEHERQRDPSNSTAYPETFPALKVRVECLWFEESADTSFDSNKSSVNHSKNSFSVPEEDDEVEIIVPETAPENRSVFSPIHYTIPISDDSEDGSSDDGHAPKSSPPTSPPDGDGKSDDKNAVSTTSVNEDNEKKDTEQAKVAPETRRESSPMKLSVVMSRPSSLERDIVADIGALARERERERELEQEQRQLEYLARDEWNDEEHMGSEFSEAESSSSESDQHSVDEHDSVDSKMGDGEVCGFEESYPREGKSVREHLPTGNDKLPTTTGSFPKAYEQPCVQSDSEGGSEDGSEDGSEADGHMSKEVNKPHTGVPGLCQRKSTFVNQDMPPQMAELCALGAYTRNLTIPAQPILSEQPGKEPIGPNAGWDTAAPSGSWDFAPRAPSPSDKALAKPFTHEFPENNASLWPSWYGYDPQPVTRHPGLPHVNQAELVASLAPKRESPRPDGFDLGDSVSSSGYLDGPFARPQPRRPDREFSRPSLTAHESNFEHHLRMYPNRERDSIPPWHRDYRFPKLDSVSGGTAKPETFPFPNPNRASSPPPKRKESEETAKPSTTRVAISDIVDQTPRARLQTLRNSLKRTAEDMEVSSAAFKKSIERVVKAKEQEETIVPLESNNSLPDAQPQNIVPETSGSVSQLTELFPTEAPTEEVVEVADVAEAAKEMDEQPPRKRVKITTDSRPGNFTRYAATALAGAVVGGVGAIAALVALPPEFFA